MARVDAVRNRARLVAAAREVFAERGLAATLDDVAERAGVGTGTAYRHFRNKQELAAEVLGNATEQIAIDATNALTIDDPWDGLVSFFESTVERKAADRGLYQALAGLGRAEDKVRHWPAILDATTTLFTRARDSGALRHDAEPGDAVVVFAMLGAAYDLPDTPAGPAWRRYLAVLLDGLHAGEHAPLPVPAPTFGSLDDVIAASKQRAP